MVFATFDANGFPTGFFVEDLHGRRVVEDEPNPNSLIPADAVEIDQSQHNKLVSQPGQWRWNGETVVVFTPPLLPPTVDDVLAERARRLSAGFNFDFGDGRGVHRIGTTDADQIGWDEVTKYSQALVAAGQGEQQIGIVSDTGPTMVTAVEWQSILIAAGEFRQPIWTASFILQAMNPIPPDFADDGFWP